MAETKEGIDQQTVQRPGTRSRRSFVGLGLKALVTAVAAEAGINRAEAQTPPSTPTATASPSPSPSPDVAATKTTAIDNAVATQQAVFGKQTAIAGTQTAVSGKEKTATAYAQSPTPSPEPSKTPTSTSTPEPSKSPTPTNTIPPTHTPKPPPPTPDTPATLEAIRVQAIGNVQGQATIEADKKTAVASATAKANITPVPSATAKPGGGQPGGGGRNENGGGGGVPWREAAAATVIIGAGAYVASERVRNRVNPIAARAWNVVPEGIRNTANDLFNLGRGVINGIRGRFGGGGGGAGPHAPQADHAAGDWVEGEWRPVDPDGPHPGPPPGLPGPGGH